MKSLVSLSIFFCFFPYVAFTQFLREDGKKNKEITYVGKIVDAETGDALSFAQINHIYKLGSRDSMIIKNYIANKDGSFSIQVPRVMDNRFEIICLGYKILTRLLNEAGNGVSKKNSSGSVIDAKNLHKTTEIYNLVDLGILKLEPDVQLLDEVEVKARLELFRHSGDTLLVFPRNMKQMEGDALVDLLKRHPGFHVSENGDLYVDGKKIERAMLNNKHIFGDQVKIMIHSILAKEAGLIKVYDEIDETSEILNGTEFADKRKVMNVITFKDFNTFKGGELGLETGVYSEKDYDNYSQMMYHANARIGQYNDQFRIAIHGNLDKTAFPQKKQDAQIKMNAEFSSSDLLKSISTNYNYAHKKSEQISRSQFLYTPTTYFETQVSESNSQSDNKTKHHFIFLSGRYIKKKQFSIEGQYEGAFNDISEYQLSISKLTTDKQKLSYTQRLKNEDRQTCNNYFYLKITPSLGQLGALQLTLSGDLKKNSGDGLRVDTNYSKGVSDMQLFELSSNKPTYRAQGRLSYNSSTNHIFNKSFVRYSLGYRLNVSYRQNDDHYLSVNRLTEQVDSILSREQTIQDLKISNEILLSLNIHKYHIFFQVHYDYQKLQLNECFPYESLTQNRFNALNMEMQLDVRPFVLYYKSTNNYIPAHYLSSRLNDHDPMNLSSGNPQLKMGKTHHFELRLGSLKILDRFSLTYQYITHPIINSHVYFPNNTFLSKYGNYEVLAGSILTIPINSKAYHNFDFKTSFNTKRGILLLRNYLEYTYENPPVDLLGEIVRSRTHKVSYSLSLLSNFSAIFRIDVKNGINLSDVRTTGIKERHTRNITNTLKCDLNINLFYRMMINTDFNYNYHYNTYTQKTINRNVLNASVDFRIFSNRQGLIGFHAYNVFNSRSSLTSIIEDLGIKNVFQPQNSSLFSISFKYKFGIQQ